MSPKRVLISLLAIFIMISIWGVNQWGPESKVGSLDPAAASLWLQRFLTIPSAYGDEIGKPVGQCQDAFPNLVSDIPWQALFPIRIGGQTIINMGEMPDNIDTANGAFDSKCLETDADGKCTRWSAAKDLITNTYKDCEKVMIPTYDDPPAEVSCSGSNQITTTACEVTTYVNALKEDLGSRLIGKNRRIGRQRLS